MRRPLFIGAILLAVVIAAVAYFTQGSAERPDSNESAADETRKNDSAIPSIGVPRDATSTVAAGGTTVPNDPRLDALQVSTDNGSIEFVKDSSGKVIKEIDSNPSSLGYKKPSREYTYAGDRVIELVAYQYLSDYIQTTKTSVAYRSDGTVDQFLESTSYVYPKKGSQK